MDDMMAPRHGTAFHITGPLWGESIEHDGWLFDVYFLVDLNKSLAWTNSRPADDFRRRDKIG